MLARTSPTPAARAHHGVLGQARFAALGEAFYTTLRPQPLPDARRLAHSTATAQMLGIDADWLSSEEALAALSGNTVLEGTQALASVYSGHQFGVWAGQLGDGRAHLLGETPSGWEIQLKGSGHTPYSRMGDGRAVLRSSIREYLASHAMHGLGIPTTQALCLCGSSLQIARETMEEAAVLTRAAPSFLRFGHFEHFAHHDMPDALRALADFTIAHYYPDCDVGDAGAARRYCALLRAISERTAHLVAQWQAVGFCHGVMNTDNMSVLGLTIDYGPFQFLDTYVPGHVCNHSDTHGRYAYARQPQVAHWNLFCLAQALLPLIQEQDLALEALSSYQTVYTRNLLDIYRAKLGLLPSPSDDAVRDQALVSDLLALLAQDHLDYTNFWRLLSHAQGGRSFHAVRELFTDRAAIDAWLLRYSERLAPVQPALAADLMLKTNPKFVLRNHLAELAIRSAQAADPSEIARLQALLESPFDEHPGAEAYAQEAPPWASELEISCSS